MTGIHVTPLNDLREHDNSVNCWCKPVRLEDEPNVIVHNSMDRREHSIEKGKVQ